MEYENGWYQSTVSSGRTHRIEPNRDGLESDEENCGWQNLIFRLKDVENKTREQIDAVTPEEFHKYAHHRSQKKTSIEICHI